MRWRKLNCYVKDRGVKIFFEFANCNKALLFPHVKVSRLCFGTYSQAFYPQPPSIPSNRNRSIKCLFTSISQQVVAAALVGKLTHSPPNNCKLPVRTTSQTLLSVPHGAAVNRAMRPWNRYFGHRDRRERVVKVQEVFKKNTDFKTYPKFTYFSAYLFSIN